ncbi:MAG: alpha-amylase family glycosyl hydrolase [Anaerolineae bacterium]|nr:alpha-amylase family glycosyl hydrolase [Anaerolineae bacterium]
MRDSYGDELGRQIFTRLQSLISNLQSPISQQRSTVSGQPSLSHRDALLITYPDQVREPNVPPLRTLGDFCAQHLAGLVSTIHILPFYPYSSDDGFSVIDYRAVNPALGDWNDVTRIGAHFRLMFDAVINHVSSQSTWFQAFLRDDPRYRDWFIVVPDGADVSRVIRPRTSPLLTRFETSSGAKNVWTTFSADQIDLNYRNPDVLIEIIETLLFYLARGASWIRLDAIAFLWKEFGTTCLHLPQTHRIIQLLRAIVDKVAPHTILITETNVPHADNISYFGDGTNEAHLVYNFALPPLVLHTFHTGDARTLTRWASELKLPSQQVTFLNFLASHDGIGLNPARGILRDEEIDALVARTLAHGGLVSYKSNSDGTPSPYELNIVYYDALNDPNANESLDTQIDRFVCAHAIMLALVGVPAIYFHSLFGSRNWREGVTQKGHNRTINREKFEHGTLERELRDPSSRRARVFARLAQLLRVRATHPAFDPYGEQRIVNCGDAIFALERISPRSDERVLCLHNVSGQPQPLDLGAYTSESFVDAITHQSFRKATLVPYQVVWLVKPQ